jgi:hypothetical protein
MEIDVDKLRHSAAQVMAEACFTFIPAPGSASARHRRWVLLRLSPAKAHNA